MRSLVFALLVAVLLVGAASAQYHDSKYLFGGYGTTSSLYAQGPWMADAGNQTFTKLSPPGYWIYGYGMTMDVDNKKVINLTSGSTSTSYQFKSGIYRTDPATKSITTVFYDTNLISSTSGAVHVNQDGDYVFPCYSRQVSSSITTYHYYLMKVPSLGGSATTLLTTIQLGWAGRTYIYQGGAADMNTGDYVVSMYNFTVSPRAYYGIYNLSLDGSKLTTWSTGGTYGLYCGWYDALLQDWDANDWKCIYGDYLYQLKPGTMARTTLYNLGYAGALRIYYAGKFDNRSAPKPRVMIGGYVQQFAPTTYYAPACVAVDVSGPPYLVTYVNCDPTQKTAKRYNYPYAFNFYRGRHVQTLTVAPKKWQLRISCPRYPNKAYAAAISLTGYRPPITLGDGRRIFLRPDSLTLPSLNGWTRPYFDGGPGKLDANGEAQGSLDLTALPSLGLPLWIAVLVLDPAAPGGIAYIPDTYVFKLP